MNHPDFIDGITHQHQAEGQAGMFHFARVGTIAIQCAEFRGLVGAFLCFYPENSDDRCHDQSRLRDLEVCKADFQKLLLGATTQLFGSIFNPVGLKSFNI